VPVNLRSRLVVVDSSHKSLSVIRRCALLLRGITGGHQGDRRYALLDRVNSFLMVIDMTRKYQITCRKRTCTSVFKMSITHSLHSLRRFYHEEKNMRMSSKKKLRFGSATAIIGFMATLLFSFETRTGKLSLMVGSG